MLLSLETLIPQDATHARLCEAMTLHARLCALWPQESMMYHLDFVTWLPDFSHDHRELLTAIPLWNGTDPTTVHVYVDGSSFANRHDQTPAEAGWAFIIVLQCDFSTPKFFFYGASACPLTSAAIPADMSLDVGELLSDALTAEATGMVWTQSWLMQSPFKCQHVVHYDNSTTGPYAAGSIFWDAPWEYTHVRDRICALRHCLQMTSKQISFEHEKAHSGALWSDLVDALAKSSAKGIIPPAALPPHVPALRRHPSLRLAWIAPQTDGSVPNPVYFNRIVSC